MKLIPITLSLLLSSCALRGAVPTDPGPTHARWSAGFSELQVSHPPFQTVHANWKDRRQVPYVYLEIRGIQADREAMIPILQHELEEQGLVADGPPFCLFYDIPDVPPTESSNSRVCMPVHREVKTLAPLEFGVLPSTTVAYGLASGVSSDVRKAWTGIFDYVERQNWVPNGPLREIYLVVPGTDSNPADLLSEVQVPVRSAH
ncbi:MAG: GyrI-like domain-containing protein [bacterium]